MKRLRDLIVDGALLALPLGAAAFLLHRVVGLLAAALAPISHLLPEGRWFGIAALDLTAILVLVVALILLGVFARSAPGRQLSERLEQVVLSKVPGYLRLKSIAAGFATTEDHTRLRPPLVSFDDSTVLGFIGEESQASDMVTVFVPGAPAASSGTVVLVTRTPLQVVDLSIPSVRHSLQQLGLDLQNLAPPSRSGLCEEARHEPLRREARSRRAGDGMAIRRNA